MKIAICDDEQIWIARTKEYIKSTIPHPEECKIICFSSGEELIENYKNQKFDIIILDIILGGINGIDTARKIREIDNNVIIIFFTCHSEYALEGYEVNAHRFLIKNQSEYLYKKHFKSIFSEYAQKQKFFRIFNKNNKIYIPLMDICFFEVTDKTITVHTLTNSYEYIGKLSEIENKLQNDKIFIRTHRSYIANVAQIERLRKYDILMKNRKNILLSRTQKKIVTDKYTSYIAENEKNFLII